MIMKKIFALLFLLAIQVMPQIKPELILPVSHKDKIETVCFSPDGNFILTASWDNTAKLWDANTGILLRNITAHTKQVDDASFSPDGSMYLTRGWDHRVLVWETSTGRKLSEVSLGDMATTSSVWSPDGSRVLIATMSGTAFQMDPLTGVFTDTLAGHSGTVEKARYSPDGKFIVTVGWDQTAGLWNTSDFRQFIRMQTGFNWAIDAGFSPNSKYFYTSGYSGTIQLWETSTTRMITSFLGNADDRNIAAFSPDSRLIATPTAGDSVVIRNTSNGRIEQILYFWREEPSRISNIIFTEDGSQVLVTFFQSGPVIYNVEAGDVETIFVEPQSLVGAADISPDGSRLLFGDYNGKVIITDFSGETLLELKGKTAAVTSVQFSPDGSNVAVMDEHLTAGVWDAVSGKSLARLTGPYLSYWFAACHPAGKLIALPGYDDSGDYNTGIYLWNWEENRLERFIPTSSDMLFFASFSPDGKMIGLFGGDTTIAVYETGTGRLLKRIKPSAQDINVVRFSPDSKFLVSANRDSTASIYDLSTGKEIKKFFGHTSFVMDAAFSPDGKKLVTGSIDATVKLWDIASGKMTRDFYGGDRTFERVFFSPDGKTVVAFNDEKQIFFWDVATGEPTPEMMLTNNGRDISFTRDMIVTEKNSVISFYDINDRSLLISIVGIDSTDWCVIHPSGLFDATPGAMEKMYYIQGLDRIEFGQLKDKYWEPGLFEKVMTGEQLRSVSSIDKEMKLWPEVTDLTFRESYEKLTVSLKNQGGGIGKVQVFLNGKEMISDARGTSIKPDQGDGNFDINLKDHPWLINGENRIVVVTWNGDGTLSSPGDEADFLYEKSDQTPSAYIVSIGVADYQGDKLDLKYAAKDATDFMKAVSLGAGHLFGRDRTEEYLITTDASSKLKPTRDNILKTFSDIASKANAEDVLVVYLAGHGMNLGGEESDLYYLTQEAFSPNPEVYKDASVRNSTTISGNELVEVLKKIAALKQVLIIDACASGKLVDNLAEKRDIAGSIIRSLERMKDRTGLHIITGSAADAVSYEASKYGQGLLTYSLLAGMRGLALKDNRSVDIVLLMQHAREMVPKLAEGIGGIQEPRIFSPKGSESFDIGVLDEKDKALIPLAQEKPVFINSVFLNADDLVDDLSLAEKIDDGLEALSVAGFNSKLIFWDVKSYPGALKLSGTYTVKGNKVELNWKIIKDKTTVKSFNRSGELTKLEVLVTAVIEDVKGFVR